MPDFKKVVFYTIGCRLNQSETAVLKNLFHQRQYTIVTKAKPAKIAIINTCTVTEKSDSDTKKLINKIVRENPAIEIALIGCQAQLQKEQIIRWPNVRWIIGNARKMETAAIIEKASIKAGPEILLDSILDQAFTIPAAGIDRQRTRANLKIQDGCNSFCSYCIVPYARGPARSRVFEDIIKEAGLLAQAGYQELVITGINIGRYNYEGNDIADVIKSLVKIPGIARIRISSIEPTTIPQKLLEIMSTKSQLCRHLHIPLQSGDNDILKLMNRNYRTDQFLEFIKTAANMIPGIFIGSDVIAGFPGESESHFNHTYRFLSLAPINYFHVFSYSKRHLAASQSLPAPVPQKIIQARSQSLRKLGRQKRQTFYRTLLGSRHTVLFENKKNGCWKGFTDNYIPVLVKSGENLSNQLRDVTLHEIAGDAIQAELAKRNKIRYV